MAQKQEKTYPFHPYSEFFPLLEGDDLDALAKDIKSHGLIHPIVLCNGSILDSRNRCRAYRIAGIPPRYEEFEGSEAEAMDYAVSLNLILHHLSTPQRAVLALQLLPHEKEKALTRMKAGKTDPTQNNVEGKGKGEAIQIVGKKVGVSGETVRQANKMADTAPDVIKAIVSGVVKTMPEAIKLTKLDKKTRTKTIQVASQKKIRISMALQEVQPRKGHVLEKAARMDQWSTLHSQVVNTSRDKDISLKMLIETRNHIDDEINHREFSTINGFVPYMGGKTRGLKDILVLINAMVRESDLGRDFEFREPFVGGGSVSVNIIKNGIAPKARISDVNFPLVAFITTVIKDPEPIYNYIENYELTKETADELLKFMYDVSKGYLYFDRIVNEIVNKEIDQEDLNKPISENPELLPFITKLAFAKFVTQKTGVSGLAEVGGTLSDRWIKERWKPEPFCNHIAELNDVVYDRIVGNRCFSESFEDAIDRSDPCFIFADPPYVADGTRKKFYPHGLTEDEHISLMYMFEGTRHPYLLTYGDDKGGLIRNLYSNTTSFYVQPVKRMSGKNWINELWIVPARYKSVIVNTPFEKVKRQP